MRSPFLKSFVYAAKGIGSTFRLGFNFKVMLVIGIIAIILGIFLGLSFIEWVVIVVCIGVVLAAECLNTAIESTVDLLSPDYHELAGIAKDCAAGGVLLLSIAAIVVACFIFLPKLIALFI